MFSAKRLGTARKRRRLTSKALAEAAGLAVDTVSRLENGANQPDEDTVAKIAKALSFPLGFFFDSDPEEIDVRAVSFRSFSKMSARERDAALAAGSLGLQLSAWVDERFDLSPANLLDLSYLDDPASAAMLMRQHWVLGEKPIGNILGLLETQGVRIFSLSENTATVNAFSFWMDERPFIFLNNFKTAESSIFDTVHELGHLVMHKHGDPKEHRSVEKEANAFASSFLMPENDVRSRVRSFPSVDSIIAAKSRWRVSAMAMAYRLHQLGILTEWNYKSACIELTQRGYRSGEPMGIERETSIVWRKILAALWTDRITKSDIASSLNLPPDELEGLIWNLAGVPARPEERAGQLRAVG